MNETQHKMVLSLDNGATLSATVTDETATIIIENVARSHESTTVHFVNVADINDNTILFAPNHVVALTDEIL